jgi:exodeoxyribonuclease VII, small subunit
MAKSPPKNAAKQNEEPASFEAAMTEVEALVASMEEGALPLADALKAYQRGAVLLSYCQKELRAAQQQVRILEEGMLKDFHDDDEE